MTDRETLQSVENALESVLEIVRAQLATNVIPVPPTPSPPPATPVIPTQPQPSVTGLNPVTAAWLGGGSPAAPSLPTDVPQDAQPEFRDGSVHTFPGAWRLVADRDCVINFNGGEVPGSPGQSHITLSVNGQEIARWDQPNTVLNPPPAATNVSVSRGASIVLTITGAPMEARLAVR